MSYQKIRPVDGDRITANPDGSLNVPDQPIIPFIEGDGIGPDITAASMHIWTHRSFSVCMIFGSSFGTISSSPRLPPL